MRIDEIHALVAARTAYDAAQRAHMRARDATLAQGRTTTPELEQAAATLVVARERFFTLRRRSRGQGESR